MMVATGDLFGLIRHAVIGLFRSRAALQAEILILRHQINILRRKSPKRVALGNIDRAVLIGLYRLRSASRPGSIDAATPAPLFFRAPSLAKSRSDLFACVEMIEYRPTAPGESMPG
jgi:hypothetical protein